MKNLSRSKLIMGMIAAAASFSIVAGYSTFGSISNAESAEDYYVRNAVSALGENEAEFVSIDNSVLDVYQSVKYDNVAVSRDYYKYTNIEAKSRLSAAELEFYNRLDAAAYKYLSTNADASALAGYGCYVMPYVNYSTAGLTKQQAFSVAAWFVYNNPQYYFLTPKFLASSTYMYIAVYNDFAIGDTRKTITDRIFSIIDSCVESIPDGTFYNRELAVHNTVCNLLTYAESAYEQSVYSAAIDNSTRCVGYAEFFSMICNAAGIDCLVVYNDGHVWNIVKIDGNWYIVDTTWDDTLHGTQLFNVGVASSKRYDSNSEHIMSGDVTAWAPSISSSDYVVTPGDLGANDPVNLDIPTNVRHSYHTASTLYVNWDTVTYATGYQVEVYSNSERVSVTDVTSNEVFINNADLYGDFTVRIRAFADRNNTLYYSDWVTYDVTSSSVKAPTDISVNVENVVCSVAWNGIVDSSVSYQLQFCLNPDYTGVLIDRTLAGRGLRIRGINQNTAYYGRIRTLKTVGANTAYSDWVPFAVNAPVQPATSTSEVTTQGSVTPPAVTDPAETTSPVTSSTSDTTAPVSGSVVTAPVNFKASLVETGKYMFTWDYSDADEFEFKLSTDVHGNNVIFSKSYAWTAVSIKGFSSDIAYYAHLRSVKYVDGQPVYSDWSTITVQSPQESVNTSTSISAPDNFRVVRNESVATKYNMTWSGVPDVKGYEIKISMNDMNGSIVLNKTYASGVTGIAVNGFSSSYRYCVALRSVYENDYSDWVYVIIDSTGAASGIQTSVAEPYNVAASLITSTKFGVTWQGDAERYGYQLALTSDFASPLINNTTTSKGVAFNGAKSGTTYYVRIRSITADNKTSNWVVTSFAF